MKFSSRLFLSLLVTLALSTTAIVAQQPSAFHVAQIDPYDKAVPGQVMQLLVEGIAGEGPFMPVDDFKVSVSQDGVSQVAKVRTVTRISRTVFPAGKDNNRAGVTGNQMRSYQSVNFVVPQGLHPGETEVTLSYQGRRGNSLVLTIIEKPLRPQVANLSVVSINPAALPTKFEGNDLGWRLERGATAQLFVNPGTDPDDPNSAVLIRFKQGDTYFDAQTRVTNHPFRVEDRKDRGVSFFPARDILEVDVPAGLSSGPAEIEVRLRANGQDGEAATQKATIVDSAQSAEAPAVNAPRLVMVMPTRISAGQSLMLSVDYRRTLDPDPAKALILVEQGSARYVITPENSSEASGMNMGPDMPVLFFARTTKQIIGKAQVRIFNQLRGQQAGMSEPVAIEILEETLPPELISVNESTASDLAPLRQMYEIQLRAGRKFSEYDPERKYVTIQAKRIDYNPNYTRFTFEQAGRRFTLVYEDISLSGGDTQIVRLPKGIRSGPVKLTIENRGVDGYSVPAGKTFEICCTP